MKKQWMNFLADQLKLNFDICKRALRNEVPFYFREGTEDLPYNEIYKLIITIQAVQLNAVPPL